MNTMLGSCPHRGELIRSDTTQESGSMLAYHPLRDSVAYTNYDKKNKKACCTFSSGLCKEYFRRTILSDGNGYKAPQEGNQIMINLMFEINNNFVLTAFGWGDPHYNTLDNVHVGTRFGNRRNWYDFQGDGQFVLLRILNQGGIHVFELQGELRPTSPGSGVTVHKKLAFGVPRGATFQVLTCKLI